MGCRRVNRWHFWIHPIRPLCEIDPLHSKKPALRSSTSVASSPYTGDRSDVAMRMFARGSTIVYIVRTKSARTVLGEFPSSKPPEQPLQLPRPGGFDYRFNMH